MTIRNLSQDVLFITLPEEPQTAKELKVVNEMVHTKADCDVIVDFTKVEMVTSSNINNLLILHKTLSDSGHRLIFCRVNMPTKCIFRVAGLDEHFEFAEDKFAALEALKTTK